MEPQSSPPAVELEGVRRCYGERVALDAVSLTLAAGATLLVLGPNGAGKSTLLRVLSTLLRPHAGEARVLGWELPVEAWAVRSRVGLVAHEPLLYRDLSPRENLRLQARLHRAPEARTDELLGVVGLTARADEPVRTLSRGMLQRVAICRAVLHEPAVLLADEPLAGLDPAGREAVAPLIGTRDGLTRVIAAHERPEDLGAQDQVLGLRAGRVAFAATASALDAADVKELYA